MRVLAGILVLGISGYYFSQAKLFISAPTEAEWRLLENSYKNSKINTEALLEQNFVTCLSVSDDKESVQFAAKVYSSGISHSIEFRLRSDLPAIGSADRDEIEKEDKKEFAKSLKEQLARDFASMPIAQKQKLTKFGSAIEGQKQELLSCATFGAIRELANPSR